VTQARKQAETTPSWRSEFHPLEPETGRAALLKIDYKALLYKMKKLGVEDRPDLVPPNRCGAHNHGCGR